MVASYTQLLAKRYNGRLDSDADEFIAYAVDGCNRMQQLIQDLLAYSRAGADGKARRVISSEDALQEALMNLRAMIEESGAVVTHDSLPTITDGRYPIGPGIPESSGQRHQIPRCRRPSGTHLRH